MSKKITHFGRICVTYVLVFAIVFSFVMSSFVGLNITASAETPSPNPSASDLWDGSKPESLVGLSMNGQGTAASPYQVTNGAQLWYAVNNTEGKYFKVMNNINLNDVSNFKDWAVSGPSNIWNPTATFSGTFDGNGKSIIGLYSSVQLAKGKAIGLFANLGTGAKIYNVVLDSAYIEQTSTSSTNWTYVGGIAGAAINADDVNIFGCVVKSSCLYNRSASSSSSVGGILGITYGSSSHDVTVKNCYAVDNTLSNSTALCSGIVADYWTEKLSIIDCFTTGYAVAKNGSDATVVNCYTNADKPYNKNSNTFTQTAGKVNQISKEDMTGNLALTNMNLSESEWVAGDSYPTPKKHNELYFNEADKNISSTEFAGGTGTKKDPYQIKNAAQLYKAVNSTDTAGKYYKLIDNITINNAIDFKHWNDKTFSVHWDPTATFGGTFDGNGKKIIGLYSANASANIGLFAKISNGAKIYNVILDSAYLSQTDSNKNNSYVGGIVANADGVKDFTIFGCVVRKSILKNSRTAWTCAVGGIVGCAYDGNGNVINNCAVVDTELTGGAGRAGIVGMHWNGGITVTNCFVTEYSLGHQFNNSLTASNCYITVDRPFEQKNNNNSYGELVTSGVSKITNAELMKGDKALGNMNLLDTEWTVTESYPLPKLYSEVYTNDFDEADKESEKVEFAGGTGTKNDPYQIENAAQLYKAVNSTDTAGKYYQVTKNITINKADNISNWSDGSDFENWDPTATFGGTFDGAGCSIIGLYSANASDNIGLFAKIANGAKIYNVILDSAYLSQTDSNKNNSYVGGIVANADGVEDFTIYGCIVKNSILKNSRTAWTCAVGGIVGCAYNGKGNVIKSCAVVDTKLTGGAGRAGIVGMHWSGGITVTDCFVTGYSLGHQFNNGLTASNCYITVDRPFEQKNNNNSYGELVTSGVSKITDAELMKGDKALENMNLLDTEWTATEGYPLPKLYKDVYSFTDADKDITTTEFAGGTGEIDDPYQIENAAQLYKAVNSTDTLGKYYKVINDITINNTDNFRNWDEKTFSVHWDPTETFRGTFDGGGFTISGLYAAVSLTTNWAGLGLFAKLGSDATVFNVTVDQAYIEQTNTSATFASVGGIAGSASSADNVTVYGCVVKNSTLINRSTSDKKECSVGGLIGLVYAGGSNYDVTVKNCYAVDNTLSTDTWYCAAAVGAYWTVNLVIENCFTTGDYAFGHKNGYATIKNCYVSGNVEVPFDKVPNETNLTAGEFGDETGVHKKDSVDDMKGNLVIDKLHLSSDEWEVTASYPIAKPYMFEKGIWDGTDSVTNFAQLEGEGTAEKPYLITNGSELLFAVKNTSNNVNGKIPYFRLENDITLNARANYKKWSTEAPANTWLPSGAFVGHFDGNFKTVSGLYSAPTTEASAGLFAAVDSGSTVKNLTLTKSYIKAVGTTETVVGGIVGKVDGESDVKLIGLSVNKTILEGKNTTGGVVGLIANSTGVVTVERCSSVDNTLSCVDATSAAAGLVGDLVNNAANTVEVKDSFTTGNFICRQSGAIFKNVYTTDDIAKPFAAEDTAFNADVKKLALAEMKGNNAISNMSLDECYWAATPESYPVVKPYSNPNDFKASDKNLTLADLSGSGTQSDPYKITNAAELWVAVNNTDTSKYFRVENNIVINNTTAFENWNDSSNYEDWAPTESFSGFFDGNKKVISGLYASSSTNKYLGLFGQLSDEVRIIDVIVENAYVSYTGSTQLTFAGGLVGAAINVSDVSIFGCVVKNSRVFNKCTGEAGVGGLVGGVYANSSAYDVTIKNSYAVDNTLSSETRYCAGLVGAYWSAKLTLTDCFTTDYAFGHKNGYAIINNCFVSGNVSAPFDEIATENGVPAGEFGNSTGVNKIDNAKMKGASALRNMNFSTSNWKATDGYPESKIKFTDNDGIVGRVWSGANARSFAGGDGTEANPWKVDTPERLYRMLNNYSGKEYWFEITADIKLNNTTASDWYTSDSVKPWLVDKDFAGHVDGNGHTITGLYVENSKSSQRAALFPRVSGRATITNINIDKCYLVGNSEESYSGMLVGYVSRKALVKIAGCNVTNAVAGSTFSFGGIVGSVDMGVVVVDYCTFQGKIDSSVENGKKYGGIVGDTWGSPVVSNCISKGMAAVGSGYTVVSAVYSDVGQSKTNASFVDVNLVSASDMIGYSAKRKMSKLNWNYMKTNGNNIPTAKVAFDYSSDAHQGKAGDVWSGFAAAKYAGGTGTISDPYQISTPEQLYMFSLETMARTNEEPEYYKITDDIYLNDISNKDWKQNSNLNNWLSSGPIASYLPYFYGHLDGDYHVVYGMYSDHNSQANACAIIPRAKGGSTISRLGFSEAYMSNATKNDTYTAAFIGFVKYEGKNRIPDGEYTPIHFTECFVDNTVEFYSYYVGGFTSGTPAAVDLTDCYSNVFIGDSAKISGALLGNVFTSVYPSTFVNCYAMPLSTQTKFSEIPTFTNPDTNRPAVPEGSITNCYYFGSAITHFDFLFYKDMHGDLAKTKMSGFDFEKIWQTVDGGTPVLKRFAGAEKFSAKNDVYTTVTFVSGAEGIDIPKAKGIAMTPLTIPVPEREGYFFDGWYVYEEGHCEYTYDTFPVVDTTLYAKWNANSVTQNFENYVNTMYDYDDDYTYYRPGVAGYSSLKVHGGGKAILRKGETADEQDVILNATEPIAVGEEYKIRFWVYTEEANTNATISLVHYTWPDFEDPNLGVEKMVDIQSMEVGKWTVYTYQFKAKAPWLGIRTTGNAQLYMDDFFITPVAEYMKDASKVNDYEYFYNLGETEKTGTSQTLSGVFSTPVNTLAPASAAVSTEETRNTVALLATVILAASALVVLARVYNVNIEQEIENDIEE